MAELYLRTESIRNEDIIRLAVLNKNDKDIISTLKSSEPCIIEGSRGSGKSFLLKYAEIDIENNTNSLPVFVSFNVSSLIRTDDTLQFYHWMLAKTIKALVNKLRKKGLLISSSTSLLLSNSTTEKEVSLELDLLKIVRLYESSYKGDSKIDIDKLPDIEDVKDAIEMICEENKIDRVYFFFDESAHVFRPKQQRQFFNLFKDIRSPYISCNAAIYPGVTHYGDSFELAHDCAFRSLERSIREPEYLQYFKDIVFKQASDDLKKSIENQTDLFNTLAFSAGGNPRNLLKTIQEANKFNTTGINNVIKEFYRERIWTEHTALGEKYKGHRVLIDWGRDFVEKYVIPSIESYNKIREEKGIDESTIYFWIHKDAPEAVKESLRLLTYTGIIKEINSAIRATRAELGTRYEVKYGCIISLFANPQLNSSDFLMKLSYKKFPEFGKNHQAYNDIKDYQIDFEKEEEYLSSLYHMLQKDIKVLTMLTEWQIGKLRSAGINTLEELNFKSESKLISEIYGVGPVRARIIKNAANAELLEYLSG